MMKNMVNKNYIKSPYNSILKGWTTQTEEGPEIWIDILRNQGSQTSSENLTWYSTPLITRKWKFEQESAATSRSQNGYDSGRQLEGRSVSHGRKKP